MSAGSDPKKGTYFDRGEEGSCTPFLKDSCEDITFVLIRDGVSGQIRVEINGEVVCRIEIWNIFLDYSFFSVVFMGENEKSVTITELVNFT